MSDYHPIIHALDAKFARQREDMRQLLYAEGRPDLVEEFDRKMREIDTGINGARNCWHSISEAQRRVLNLAATGRWLVRSPGTNHFYDAHGEPHALSRVAGLKTVRNLCARELLAYDGGAIDPERKMVITERGLFVVKHGQFVVGGWQEG